MQPSAHSALWLRAPQPMHVATGKCRVSVVSMRRASASGAGTSTPSGPEITGLKGLFDDPQRAGEITGPFDALG